MPLTLRRDPRVWWWDQARKLEYLVSIWIRELWESSFPFHQVQLLPDQALQHLDMAIWECFGPKSDLPLPSSLLCACKWCRASSAAESKLTDLSQGSCPSSIDSDNIFLAWSWTFRIRPVESRVGELYTSAARARLYLERGSTRDRDWSIWD